MKFQLRNTWLEQKREVAKGKDYNAIPAPFNQYFILSLDWEENAKIIHRGSNSDTLIGKYKLINNILEIKLNEKIHKFQVYKLSYSDLELHYGFKENAEPDFKIYFQNLRQSCLFRNSQEPITLYENENLIIDDNDDVYIPPPPPPPPAPKPSEDDFLNDDIVIEEPEVEAEVFTIVENMPTFPGGEKEMLKYISKNTKYPQLAKENNIQGTVYVQFIVEQDGSITNSKILRGIGGGCDKEALRVVNSMPNWIPATQRGKNVRVEFRLPIKFVLD